MNAVQLGTEVEGTDYKKLSLYIGTAIVVILFIFTGWSFFNPAGAIKTFAIFVDEKPAVARQGYSDPIGPTQEEPYRLPSKLLDQSD